MTKNVRPKYDKDLGTVRGKNMNLIKTFEEDLISMFGKYLKSKFVDTPTRVIANSIRTTLSELRKEA